MKLLVVAFLGLHLAAWSAAESLSGCSGQSVINAFLATYAKDEVAWKKAIRLNETPGQVAPGRQLGQSAVVGYYSFVPKTWDDLSDGEKTSVIKDPRLKAFLISSRQGSLADVSTDGTPTFPIEAAKPVPVPPPVASTPGPKSILIRISPRTVVEGQGIKVDLD
ncbi:MAG TPA: hypothetical protein VNW30_04635 [Opitutaceae bacterium]|nr:hypothetical protein [Opitutaceae bacterium]